MLEDAAGRAGLWKGIQSALSPALPGAVFPASYLSVLTFRVMTYSLRVLLLLISSEFSFINTQFEVLKDHPSF